MDEIEMLCTDCEKVVTFVQPVLDDASDTSGDDLMCVLCGTAVAFAGYLLPVAA
jgi:hypothetical protein